jgi:hypothetical protein
MVKKNRGATGSQANKMTGNTGTTPQPELSMDAIMSL